MSSYTFPPKHTVLFYNSEEEYFEIIIPYIRAGLENNEFVLWSIPDTLSLKDAQARLEKSIDNLSRYINKEQLIINNKDSMYLEGSIFTASNMLNRLIEIEKKALEKGFNGICGVGDGSWAIDNYWVNFLMYENELNSIIKSRKIRALCTYSIKRLNIDRICDIGISHQSSLVRQCGSWNSLEPDKFK